MVGPGSILPSFENPPVVETVLSVQFEPLAQLRAAHLGILWQEFRERFPKTEEKPPLDRVYERFPGPLKSKFGVELKAFETPPLPRIWFLNNEETELLQVQPDRFIRNWKKVGAADRYPRYERVKAAFESDFAGFKKFAAQQGLGEIKVDQCEITYVNHIIAGEGWETLQEIEHVFPMWSAPVGQVPGRAEDVRLSARYIIPAESGQPAGRLHVDVQPATRTKDGRPMFVFNLTARGQMGIDYEFFDVGRAWIVRSFAELTTDRMHKIWRRTDGGGNS